MKIKHFVFGIIFIALILATAFVTSSLRATFTDTDQTQVKVSQQSRQQVKKKNCPCCKDRIERIKNAIKKAKENKPDSTK